MIICKGKSELDKMRKANLIVAKVLSHLETLIQPGLTTAELDVVAEEMILDMGGQPAFKGYQGYPATLCVSVNEEIVHGIPGERKLIDGDIVGIDCGTNFKGFYGDSARTFAVGKISEEAKKLLDVTQESLCLGIKKVKIGNRISDISSSIQTFMTLQKIAFSQLIPTTIKLGSIAVWNFFFHFICKTLTRYKVTL